MNAATIIGFEVDISGDKGTLMYAGLLDH